MAIYLLISIIILHLSYLNSFYSFNSIVPNRISLTLKAYDRAERGDRGERGTGEKREREGTRRSSPEVKSDGIRQARMARLVTH